jgi:hypothetical protein
LAGLIASSGALTRIAMPKGSQLENPRALTHKLI